MGDATPAPSVSVVLRDPWHQRSLELCQHSGVCAPTVAWSQHWGRGLQGYGEILPGYSPHEESCNRERLFGEKVLISCDMNCITRAHGGIWPLSGPTILTASRQAPDTRQVLYIIFYELQAAGLGLLIPQQKQITFWGISISVPCFPKLRTRAHVHLYPLWP